MKDDNYFVFSVLAMKQIGTHPTALAVSLVLGNYIDYSIRDNRDITVPLSIHDINKWIDVSDSQIYNMLNMLLKDNHIERLDYTCKDRRRYYRYRLNYIREKYDAVTKQDKQQTEKPKLDPSKLYIDRKGKLLVAVEIDNEMVLFYTDQPHNNKNVQFLGEYRLISREDAIKKGLM